MTIKEIERKINELKRKREKTNNYNNKRNISNEIIKLEREISEINQNYIEIIQDSINDLKIDEIIDIMITNDINEKEAKEKLLDIILDRNFNDLENYYNTLLFLQENKINKDNIDVFNININTLLFAKKTLDYIDEVNNRNNNNKEIKIINDKIKNLEETISSTTKASDLFTELTTRIDEIRDNLNSYNNDLDIEVNDLTNRKDNLYNKIDFYENHARGVRALKAPFKIMSAQKKLFTVEELLEIKIKEQKKEQDKLNKDTMFVWDSIPDNEKEIFFKANCSKESIISSIMYYIKNKEKDRTPLMIDMMASTIKRAKSECQLLTIKKKSLEESNKSNDINLLVDTNNITKIQNESIDNIYSKYPFLEKLSIDKLSNISEARITPITILATPKSKIKDK